MEEDLQSFSCGLEARHIRANIIEVYKIIHGHQQ